MSQEIELFEKCPQCNGTGKFQPAHGQGGAEIDCNWPGCINGFISIGKFIIDPGNDDVLDKCNDILNKCNDIFEKLNE